eukprot:gene19057-20971_t
MAEEGKHSSSKDNYILLSLAALAVAYANTESDEDDVGNQIKQADQLYSDKQVSELYQFLLKFKDSDNAELLWRFARASRDFGELDGTSGDLRKELTFQGFKAAEKAIELGSKSFACHKWYGIMLSQVGDYQGTREKIENSYKIRDHFQKAIELNPTDATSHYLLGVWFFTFADLPWYQKKLAATIFASPPNCTYSEAEEHFLHAEKIDPGFYTANQLMLAKTYLRLGKKDQARIWINKLLLDPGKTQEDAKAGIFFSQNCKPSKPKGADHLFTDHHNRPTAHFTEKDNFIAKVRAKRLFE